MRYFKNESKGECDQCDNDRIALYHSADDDGTEHVCYECLGFEGEINGDEGDDILEVAEEEELNS